MHDFEGVYRAHFTDVYRYALHLTQGDEALAEDLTSDCFIKALESIHKFRGDCELRVWLCQILKHLFLDYVRKRQIRPISEFPDTLPDPFDLEQQFIKGDESKRAHQALHKMDQPYKEVFTLRVMGGLGFQEIGELFDKTANWACVVYHRARKKLTDHLKEKE